MHIKRLRRFKRRLLKFVDGMAVVTRTDLSELGDFIRTLHPLDSGVDLIRLGPEGDGGYLIPDDLDGINYAFSPGVSTISGFEADLAKRGMKVFLADYSVDHPAESNPNFEFTKKFIGCLSNDVFMTLDDWKDSSLPDDQNDLILQMDIEGAEFETIISTSTKLLSQFRIMVIEFHFLEQLFNKAYFDLVPSAFQKVLQTHSVVHIHPNNCCGLVKRGDLEVPSVVEITFYRNDRLKQKSYCKAYPHPLDQDNMPEHQTLTLPESWHR